MHLPSPCARHRHLNTDRDKMNKLRTGRPLRLYLAKADIIESRSQAIYLQNIHTHTCRTHVQQQTTAHTCGSGPWDLIRSPAQGCCVAHVQYTSVVWMLLIPNRAGVEGLFLSPIGNVLICLGREIPLTPLEHFLYLLGTQAPQA